MSRLIAFWILCLCASACASLHTRPVATCFAAGSDTDPLYVHAHEILLSPSWAVDRAKWSIAGDEKSLKWVTDDQTCSRIALAVAPHTTAASETHVSAVQLGNAYFASFGPWSQGILLDSRFKVLTVFVVPD